MRTALLVVAMVSAPAWAVGERVVIPEPTEPFAEQLRETLCTPMECTADAFHAFDAKVVGRLVKGKKGEQVEVRVLTSAGKVKATLTAPAQEGRLSSMDLVSLTSSIVAAIEAPERVGKAAPARAAKKPVKLAAKGRTAKDRG